MHAKEFIDLLEKQGLLDQEIIEALRQQLDQGGGRITPEAVAKLLVDNGQLTSFQASKLITDLRSGKTAAAMGEEQLTAGIEGGANIAEEVEVVVEEDAVEVQAMEIQVGAVDAVGVGAMDATAVPDATVVSAEPVEAGVAMEAVPVDGDAVAGERPVSRRKKPDPQKSVWDSFKIYGVIGIIGLLLVTGFALYFILSRESADAVLAEARTAYDQQNYQVAQERYLGFLDSFGEDHEYASLARVRVVMTQLYKAAGFKQKPWEAVDLTRQELPKIADEPGLQEERANVAGLLVDVADSMVSAAEKSKETTQKEELLAKLDEHLKTMENPQFFPSTMRVTLASQLKSIAEQRQRVRRTINRNRRLDSTEASMRSSLDKKETKDAYDVRLDLLQEFPELRTEERLLSLVREASDIQQTLVRKAENEPETLVGGDDSKTLRTIALTSVSGGVAPDLRSQTLYLRAGGSVLAFNGENGQLRWRKFVGYGKDLPPVRVEDGLGVLLSDVENNEVIRCDASDGRVIWRAKIGSPFCRPIAAKGVTYIATYEGVLHAIDTDTGDSRWSTKLPQSIDSPPGIDARAGKLYQLGGHSNLYVINVRDGKCTESFYTEHDDGTIVVPPVPLFGHLFVIENEGADYANVHILQTDDQGGGLKVAQDSVRMIGNVRVPTAVLGKRMIVLTDLGEVKVFDVELAADGEKVSVLAKLAPSYSSPTLTQMAVGDGSQMWITGTRIGRFELQVHKGQIIPDWSLHDLDQFIGEPYAFDDTLVYSRVLRGTDAVRVTAADPKTGEEIWRTDVGVPIAMLKKSAGGIHAVTTLAALFDLDREALETGSSKGPIENPGARAINIRFDNPQKLGDDKMAMLYQSGGKTALIYNPSRETEKLRLIRMNLPSGAPSGGLATGGDGLFVPLTSGRAVLADWQTGAMKATPFQPASDPSASTSWTQPIPTTEDPNQIVLADSRGKIYRLRVEEQLRELSSRDLAKPLVGPAAGLAGVYVATSQGPAADDLVGYQMDSLEEVFRVTQSGRIMSGPVASEELVLITTADNRLHAFDPEGNERFDVAVPNHALAGSPIMTGSSLLVCGRDGWIKFLDPASGDEIAGQDLGEPIHATPLVIESQVLVPGGEGVVYIVKAPQA
ncbi:MAG: PQQ-binding-like beta-propeller repeat protein [Planctomycetota bacterium]